MTRAALLIALLSTVPAAAQIMTQQKLADGIRTFCAIEHPESQKAQRRCRDRQLRDLRWIMALAKKGVSKRQEKIMFGCMSATGNEHVRNWSATRRCFEIGRG